MSRLYFPQTQKEVTDFEGIKKYLDTQGVFFERWEAQKPLSIHDSQDEVLEAYAHELKPFMESRGFQSADVINIHPETPNLSTIRQKFLQEHTHSEDEVRFFVDGSGIFWFHFIDGTITRLECRKGDFLSVPAGYKHWFDLAPEYFVKAIRIFSNQEGWIANYTGSGIDAQYNPL